MKTDPVKHALTGVPGNHIVAGVGLKKVSALPLIDEMLVKDIAVPICLIGHVIHQVQHMQFSESQRLGSLVTAQTKVLPSLLLGTIQSRSEERIVSMPSPGTFIIVLLVPSKRKA